MKINKIIGKTLEVACIVTLSTLVNLGVNFKTESYVKNEVVSEFKSAIEEIKKDNYIIELNNVYKKCKGESEWKKILWSKALIAAVWIFSLKIIGMKKKMDGLRQKLRRTTEFRSQSVMRKKNSNF